MNPNATRPLDDPAGKVFGGARMANVGGSSFVNIDGENATGTISLVLSVLQQLWEKIFLRS